jgi:D-amino-acid dehydrogenase
MQERSRNYFVIGGGIVGVCCALYLQREGFKVVLADHRGPGEGASAGNGAVISNWSCEPVAMPSLLRQLPAMLLERDSPLSIRWRHLPTLAPWLLRFMANSRPEQVERNADALAELCRRAIQSYRPLLADADLTDLVREVGSLWAYRTVASFEGAAPKRRLQQDRGIKMEIMIGDELRQFEPSLAPIFERAVYYPESAYTVNSLRFVQSLAAHLVKRGGTVLRERVQGFELGGSGVAGVVTDKGRHAVGNVVVAAGAWSRELVAHLGHRVPLETERGYHIMLPKPDVRVPRMQVLFDRHGFGATPQEHGLRLAGTDELAKLDAPPDWTHSEYFLRFAREFFPGINEVGVTQWMGQRPSLPDSLPVVSASPRVRNVLFAFGHGHLGLSFGAITGRMIAALARRTTLDFSFAPYAIDRW